VPNELAERIAALLNVYALLDIVDVTELAERELEERDPLEVAALYYALSEHLGSNLGLTSVSNLERGNRWHALARLALRDDLYGSLRRSPWTCCATAPGATACRIRSPSGNG